MAFAEPYPNEHQKAKTTTMSPPSESLNTFLVSLTVQPWSLSASRQSISSISHTSDFQTPDNPCILICQGTANGPYVGNKHIVHPAARALLRESFPPLRIGQNHTTSSAIHKVVSSADLVYGQTSNVLPKRTDAETVRHWYDQ
ncbi:hypothetical protein PCH_Pc13g13930 [Penicillium rubens Wisconsin 54-1255]|uniref:Uncharacterized protein n=1 Tax=Penicillium rubens (strain ATCC 28089 / DSM 1075 / NRRL 1951 / Wisconsin 54-1255) TaxID=500485 RepID=B6H563_PENRW|nr:hypothetical protein PCH_Pc13g13930 [Penicillium rubens Wisconsin 54-1255]